MLWKWSHTHPQPAWGAVFHFFQIEAALREIITWKTKYIPVDSFLVSSSKMKCMFIINKPENVCYSGKAVSFKSFLCSDMLPFQSRLRGHLCWRLSGPAYYGIYGVREKKELTMLVSPRWARHCWALTIWVYQSEILDFLDICLKTSKRFYSHRKKKKSSDLKMNCAFFTG